MSQQNDAGRQFHHSLAGLALPRTLIRSGELEIGIFYAPLLKAALAHIPGSFTNHDVSAYAILSAIVAGLYHYQPVWRGLPVT